MSAPQSAADDAALIDLPLAARKSQSGPVAWFGGKGHLSGWIASHLPEHSTYVEPYGGAGSVLFTKSPAPIEVWNDLHGDLTNLFRVLRDAPDELERRVTLTLHSRAEYEHAVDVLSDHTVTDRHTRAWAFFVGMNQGFGGTYPTLGRWSKSKGQRLSNGMGNNTAQWWRKVGFIGDWHERLARVQIENRDALTVMRDYDSPQTTFYLDPPYPGETRRLSLNAYRHEMTDDHHEQMVGLALTLAGAVVLSGYETPLYDVLEEACWRKIHRSVHARGASAGDKARSEVLWIKPPAAFDRDNPMTSPSSAKFSGDW
jgi:DNA adenine methylase